MSNVAVNFWAQPTYEVRNINNEFKEILDYIALLEIKEIPDLEQFHKDVLINICVEHLQLMIIRYKQRYGEDYIIKNKDKIKDKYHHMF